MISFLFIFKIKYDPTQSQVILSFKNQTFPLEIQLKTMNENEPFSFRRDNSHLLLD